MPQNAFKRAGHNLKAREMDAWRKNAVLREAIKGMEHLTTYAMTERTQREHIEGAAKAFGYAQSYCANALREMDAKAKADAAAKAAKAAKAKAAADASARAAAIIAAHNKPDALAGLPDTFRVPQPLPPVQP
jgi:hypothetical protein